MSEQTRGTGSIAIIPARGGSKRIPRKNIRLFLGVPLLTRTLGILQQSRIFDRIVVSTDDEEIADVARAAGAETPFRRPAELATDFAATLPVIAHAVAEMEKQRSRFDFACCVYPAAVLSRPADYADALQRLRQWNADYVFSAASFGYPIQRALRRLPGKGTEMFWPEHRETRSQDLEAAYHDAGQFYFGTRDAWLEQRPFFTPRSLMHLLPRHRVQDIDTLEDWAHAERLVEVERLAASNPIKE